MAENEKAEKVEKAEGTLTIKVGEEDKTITSADVQELMAKHTGLQKKVEGLANFEKILDRYGVDTDTYIKHSEGAIAIASKLIEEGIIDAQGRLVQKKEAPPQKESPSFYAKKDQSSDEKVDEIAAKALGPLADKIRKIEETQARLVEWDMRNRLAKKHPDLSEEDMDGVFDTAFRDRTKTLSQHAEAFSQSRGQRLAELRKQHAKEFGVNLEEFDKKRADDKDRKEKGIDDLSYLVQDKKLSFDTSGDGKKISPKQAAVEFFKRNLGGK